MTMAQPLQQKPPDRREFLKGCEEFKKHEERDAMYHIARFLVTYYWGKPRDMANGLGVLLITWNQAFYRYGSFDYQKLENCISKNIRSLEEFSRRDISSLSASDEEDITVLFNEFLEALRIASGKLQGRRSPVAAAKALHLLAPCFFPVWDESIAHAYHCNYSEHPAEKYLAFCGIMKISAKEVKSYTGRSNKSLLKLIDEYNYSKYTKGWI